MPIKSMSQIDLTNKRVMIRQDLNVPIKNGKVTSDTRIQASIPTIRDAIEKGAAILVMSHLGRPKEGQPSSEFSLQPVVDYLTGVLDVRVTLANDYLQGVEVKAGEVVVLENVRYNKGEKQNDDALSKQYASLCDVFVMDAFGTAHRAQASTHGVAKYAKEVCAGPLLSAELDALSQALENPARPLVAIVGGSKVSTKLTVLDSLSEKVDQLIVGGGIANTFIAAEGHDIGNSLVEKELIDDAKEMIAKAQERGATIPIPSDVLTGKAFSESEKAECKEVAHVARDDMIFDIGPKSSEALTEIIKNAGTIVWNGPVGVFEFEQFSSGTKALAEAIAQSNAFSIAGGGDTLAAVDKFGISDRLSYISTGGGAFLEFLEGKTLPAVAILDRK